MSVAGQVDKQGVRPSNGLFLGVQKEGDPVPCRNAEGRRRHHIK